MSMQEPSEAKSPKEKWAALGIVVSVLFSTLAIADRVSSAYVGGQSSAQSRFDAMQASIQSVMEHLKQVDKHQEWQDGQIVKQADISQMLLLSVTEMKGDIKAMAKEQSWQGNWIRAGGQK